MRYWDIPCMKKGGGWVLTQDPWVKTPKSQPGEGVRAGNARSK